MILLTNKTAKFSRAKITSIAIALFLIFSMTASLMFLPTANAHTPPWAIPNYCYISVTNSIIGVGQQFTIVFWSSNYPPTASGAFGDRFSFTVNVVKPDGTNETLGPILSDPIGGAYSGYTPTQVGTYSFSATMAAHTVTGLPIPPGQTLATITGAVDVNDTYPAATSDSVTVTVQQNPIAAWAETPLPTQFWTRPISDLNRNWYVLAANWLAGAAQTNGPTLTFAYGTGPESAHIMWTRPMWDGGIMDARFGDIGYETYHYEGLGFTPPIVLNGVLYYNVQSVPREGWYAVNLYTGQTEYYFNTTGPVTGVSASSTGSIAQQSLAFGQIYAYESPNQHGGFPYLWSTSAPTANTWMMYDADTGNYICSIANVTQTARTSSGGSVTTGATGTAVYGADGSILRYNIVNLGNATNPQEYLQVWNTSRAIWWKPSWPANEYWEWRPGINVTYDGNNGFSLNASIPAVQGSIYCVRENQFVIGGTAGKNDPSGLVLGNLWALNLKPDSSGLITPTLLWNYTFTPPSTTVTSANITDTRGQMAIGSGAYGIPVDPEDGVFIFAQGITRQLWGFNLTTGQQIWGPTAPTPDLDFYGMMYNIYEGKILELSYGGVLSAWDAQTGKLLWNYTCSNVGFESPYGNYPEAISCICDGKIYISCGEHSPSQPLWRGPNLRCINASNGAEIWKIDNFGVNMVAGGNGGSNVVIADGFLLALNAYDNQIYCYGKGPSATTVDAPTLAITAGSSAVIRGAVTDGSPGTKQIEQAADFPNGVPAVSDDSQEAWMEYVYQQQSLPTNATGVPVSLDAIDPNGNFIHIGNVTSDTSGTFGYSWTTPDIPGKYTLIATFDGSKSYFGSYAETYAVVSAAPATPAPTATPLSASAIASSMMIPLLIVAIAIIIAIAIATILMLRKRP